MKITICPPGYAWGYAPTDGQFTQLAEDTAHVAEPFSVLGTARKNGSGDLVENGLKARSFFPA